MSKFKFGKGEGFKMPGLGSKEINTPGSFRQEQGVEDVGYCLNTEESMLPKGSSPLLAKDANFLIPDYYSTTYTASPETGDTKKTIVEEGERGSSDDDDNNVVDPGIEVTNTGDDFSVEQRTTADQVIKGEKDDYDGSQGYMPKEEWEKWLETDAGKAYLEKYSDKVIKGETTNKFFKGTGDKKREIEKDEFCKRFPNSEYCK